MSILIIPSMPRPWRHSRETRRQQVRWEGGFTFVELLLTFAILGFVMAALFTVYTSGSAISTVAGNQAAAQLAARAGMLMEEELRLAGYGFPPTQTKITAASPTAITFWADIVGASTTLTAVAAPGTTSLSVANAAGIAAGDTIYLINYDQAQALTVSAVAGTTITLAAGPSTQYPAGAQVGRPRQVAYSWDGTNTLFEDFGDGTGLQPLADGIQSLQFRYFDATDTEIPAANLAANLANIRRISIALTARSASPGPPSTFSISSTVRPRNL